jgi:hypothetical protein
MTTTRHRNQPPPHGEVRRYRYWKCRCNLCREAERIHAKRWREHRAQPGYVNPAGTARRIRGLHAIGFTFTDIAAELGTRPEWPAQLAHHHTAPQRVLRRTADKVDAVTERLLTQLRVEGPPTGQAATAARNTATRHGWHPIHAWDDIDDPDEQPYTGPTRRELHLNHTVDRVKLDQVNTGHATWGDLSRAERRAMWARYGATAPLRALARRWGIDEKTLQRLREQHQPRTQERTAA